MVALEANCSYLLSREIIIVGRHPLMATPSDLPECSQSMDEPGRELSQAIPAMRCCYDCSHFSGTSCQPGWNSQNCVSPVQSLPSLCPFPDVTPAPSWRLAIFNYISLVSLYHLYAFSQYNFWTSNSVIFSLLLRGPGLTQQELYHLCVSNKTTVFTNRIPFIWLWSSLMGYVLLIMKTSSSYLNLCRIICVFFIQVK